MTQTHAVDCTTRHAIILAAGESTRTRPLTLHRPKPLIPLLGKPLLAHILDQLIPFVEHVTLVVKYRADDIRAYFGTRYRSIALHYVEQHATNGTAGALQAVADAHAHVHANHATSPNAEPFFLLYGDNLIHQHDVLAVCRYPFAIAGLHVDDPRAFGVLELDTDGRYVQRIIEKPATPPPNALANPGIYHLDTRAYAYVSRIEPSPRGEYELTDLVALMAAQHQWHHTMCQRQWIPVGTPWDVLTATLFLLRQQEQLPTRHPDAIIAADAHIEGQVIIGNARIGNGCRIVGPALIGDGVTIDNECVITQSVVEDQVYIGTGTRISHTTVGRNATIGAHCTINYSVLDSDVTLGDDVVLLARLCKDVQPVAVTNGMVSDDEMRWRGVVVNTGRSIPSHTTIDAGTVLFPTNECEG